MMKLSLVAGVVIAATHAAPFVISSEEVAMTDLFDVRTSVEGIRKMDRVFFKMNIGSSVSSVHMAYSVDKCKIPRVISSAGLEDLAPEKQVEVQDLTGKALALQHLSYEDFQLEGHERSRSYPMYWADQVGRYGCNMAGYIGLGPRHVKVPSFAYQSMDFATFRDPQGQMKILFSVNIKDHFWKLQQDVCVKSHLVDEWTLPGQSKYVVYARIGVDSATPPIGAWFKLQFESIFDYIESPKPQYELLKQLTENGLVNDCANVIESFPVIKYQFVETFVQVAPRDYMILRSDGKCRLLVQPAQDPNVLVTGLPFMRSAVFAVTRTQFGPQVSLCNGV